MSIPAAHACRAASPCRRRTYLLYDLRIFRCGFGIRCAGNHKNVRRNAFECCFCHQLKARGRANGAGGAGGKHGGVALAFSAATLKNLCCHSKHFQRAGHIQRNNAGIKKKNNALFHRYTVKNDRIGSNDNKYGFSAKTTQAKWSPASVHAQPAQTKRKQCAKAARHTHWYAGRPLYL